MYSISLIINVRERKFHANFDVGNFRSRGRKFQGTKFPPMELSFPGMKVFGYESSSYLLEKCELGKCRLIGELV